MQYRIYFLDSAGRISGVAEEVHPDDDAAIDSARGQVAPFPAAEIWQGARRVGQITHGADEAS